MSGVDNTVGEAAGKRADEAEGESNKALAQLALGFAEETEGLRGSIVSELENALKGGISETQQSLISGAIEQSLQAGSQAREQVSDELARTGLAGTPFGISQLASTIQAGNQATSQVGTGLKNQIYQAAMQMAGSYATGQAQTATAGLGTSATNYNDLLNTNLQGFYKTVNLGK
jgi:hypothetical protein